MSYQKFFGFMVEKSCLNARLTIDPVKKVLFSLIIKKTIEKMESFNLTECLFYFTMS
jgi:hypothetical protein